MSSSPSVTDASGAMNALLPYWEALHTTTRKARSDIVCPLTSVRHIVPAKAHIFVDHAFEIHHQPAAFLAGEAFAHGGIEPHRRCRRKVRRWLCRNRRLSRGSRRLLSANAPHRRDARCGQARYRAAAGDNAQRGSGADESAGSFVHGARRRRPQNTVETAVFGNFDGNGGGVPWAIGGLELYVVAVTGQTAQHIGDDAVLRNCAGGGFTMSATFCALYGVSVGGFGKFHQVCLDEIVEFSVHNASHIGCLPVGAVVLHTAVVEYVAADLRSPLDFLFAASIFACSAMRCSSSLA